MSQLTIVLLAAFVCAASAGAIIGAPAAYATYAHAPIAAPIATYAAAPVYVDNTHFNYGYANPFANGRVDVARTGPIASHAYTFRAGTLF